MSENQMDKSAFLEDGKILTILLNEHDLFRDENSFIAILNCLSDDPPVWVPMTVSVTDEDVENILQAGVGGVVQTKNEIRMKPDVLKNGDGKLFFPGFSLQEEASEAYRKNFSWVKMPVSNCVNIALQTENLEGLVLNAFSHSVVLPKPLLAVLAEIYAESER